MDNAFNFNHLKENNQTTPYFPSQIHVKAKYSYRANKDDELTFPRHAIIQNVIKAEKEWWTGDYGGRRQHWFPAIFVEEIEPENMEERVS